MKVLLSDIDGTLLEGNNPLHEKNFQAMKEFQKQGHKIVLCSGRTLYELQMSLQVHDIPYDALVLNNGAYIEIDGEVKKDTRIPYMIGKQIIEKSLEYPHFYTMFCDNESNYYSYKNKVYDHSSLPDKEVNIPFKDVYDKGRDYSIICSFEDTGGTKELDTFITWINTHYKEYVTCHKNTIYLDIVSQGCSKEDGVTFMKDYYHAKTYAIGDSYNDLSMIRSSDIGATFTYANNDIQRHTDHIYHYVYEFIEDILGGEL